MSLTNSGTRHVSLFVPELLFGLDFLKDIPKQEVPDLPALQLIFTRASKAQDGYDDVYRGICDLIGITVASPHDLPLAAINLASQKNSTVESHSNYIIFAEPVAMQADRDSLVLLDSLLPNSQNSLTEQESRFLIAEVNLHFADQPWQLHLDDQGVWYLNLSSKSAIATTPISDVLLKNTQHYIPVGEDARYWRQIINEIEMLFFASKVNSKRLENNKVAVSSLWLWGGGHLPSIKHEPGSAVICGDALLLQSISQFVDVPFKKLSTNTINELIHSADFNKVLIVDSSLKKSWLQRDLFSWLDALKEMEKKLFDPILSALRKGRIDNLELYLDNNHKLCFSRRLARSWWKPVKRLEDLAKLL